MGTDRRTACLLLCHPGLLLAVPYGALADRWGRKPVMLMSVWGLLLAITSILVICWLSDILPLQLVWVAWLFTLLGGGTPVGLSTVMTMITETVEPSQRSATLSSA
jgi:MFS family permease